METSLIIVIVLLLLAAVDLTVGVANDAINFLNSAIGSKAAKFRTALAVAAVGVFIGASLSGGMMEVARKGIFNPQMFIMSELLIIFLAVMFTDILLLDLFNTLGLPTSTTVSLIFGLFGSSMALATIKTFQQEGNFFEAFQYINSANLLAIISAILLSIVFAFVFGYIVQYLTRLIFTFDYTKTFKKYGALWGGVALTSISMFILLKGIKGSPYIPENVSYWIKHNTGLLSAYIFVGWAAILQILLLFTNVNVLRLIVLAGTFSLAMAFAANDLVNFIGAPLAGLKAYQIANAAGDPLTSMLPMTEKFPADTWLILIAGVIMVTTLFLSKKARTVALTEISLGTQHAGDERFESNLVAREIVRVFLIISKFISGITPKPIRDWVISRFDLALYKPEMDSEGDIQAFDLIRAAVILMVAAGLISFATSFKLPLSTTYVTFIVAMAAALPDKAWGRESAVYRVSGVVTVVAGWFVTAIAATLFAAFLALILFYTDIYGVFGLLAVTAFIMTKTHLINKKFHENLDSKKELQKLERLNTQNPILGIIFEIGIFIEKSKMIIEKSYTGLVEYKVSLLKEAKQDVKENNASSIMLVNNVLRSLKDTPDEDDDTEFAYTQALGNFQDINDRLEMLTKQNYNYVNNHHDAFDAEQAAEIDKIKTSLTKLLDASILILKERKFEDVKSFEDSSKELKKVLKTMNKLQLARIKESTDNLKRTKLYLNILTDAETIRNEVTTLTQSAKNLFIQAKKYDPKLS